MLDLQSTIINARVTRNAEIAEAAAAHVSNYEKVLEGMILANPNAKRWSSNLNDMAERNARPGTVSLREIYDHIDLYYVQEGKTQMRVEWKPREVGQPFNQNARIEFYITG